MTIYFWDEEKIRLLKLWYLVNELSLSEIADGLGVTYSAVKNELTRLGIRRNKSQAISLQLTKLWRDDKEYRQRIVNDRYNNEQRKESTRKTMLDKWANDVEYRRKCSAGNSRSKKEAWKDPTYVRKMYMAWQSKPNSKELTLNDFLQSNFPGEWKYVGDGSFSIGGQIPDFINVNGCKIAIELNGCYWHLCKECGFSEAVLPNGMTYANILADDAKKKEVFKEYGFTLITIWEHELENFEGLRNIVIL